MKEKILVLHRYVKVGTMPGEVAYVKLPPGGAKVGMRIEVMWNGRWEPCIIDKVGPWPEGRLFLSLF